MGKTIAAPMKGWVLLTRMEDDLGHRTGDWFVAWHEIFLTKKAAHDYATDRKWPKPWRAVRGGLLTI